jgi:D-sedoheptulose 7-phosphate isomerase
MSQMEERIKMLFANSIEAKLSLADILPEIIAKAGRKLVNCLLNDGKILVCGNGGSAANGLHFTAAMLNLFEIERPALPVITLASDPVILSSIAQHGHYDNVFARQIHALGQEKDILLILSASGNSSSLLQAINAANERNMDMIALNGHEGGILASHLGPEDIEIRVNSDNSARIREMHLFILHCFCDLIDQALFGQILE